MSTGPGAFLFAKAEPGLKEYKNCERRQRQSRKIIEEECRVASLLQPFREDLLSPAVYAISYTAEVEDLHRMGDGRFSWNRREEEMAPNLPAAVQP